MYSLFCRLLEKSNAILNPLVLPQQLHIYIQLGWKQSQNHANFPYSISPATTIATVTPQPPHLGNLMSLTIVTSAQRNIMNKIDVRWRSYKISTFNMEVTVMKISHDFIPYSSMISYSSITTSPTLPWLQHSLPHNYFFQPHPVLLTSCSFLWNST